MKETFTIEEIRLFLAAALKKAKMNENDDNDIANVMNRTWNRGVNAMFNRALVEMYSAAMEEDKNNVTTA